MTVARASLQEVGAIARSMSYLDLVAWSQYLVDVKLVVDSVIRARQMGVDDKPME